MGLSKYINFRNLSAADKKALKKWLEEQKKALQDAMKTTDNELASLKSKSKKSKTTKKRRKAKK